MSRLKTRFYGVFFITFSIIILKSISLFPQSRKSETIESIDTNIKMGAYYFDGWTGTYPYHITPELIKSFPERESKWGWITSSQEIMNEQIELASNSGLSFFSFCWYYNGVNKYKNEPLNRSLGFYLLSTNNKRLQYTLLVANHAGFVIGPDDWPIVCNEWINQFKSKSYLTVDGKPLITFFSIGTLLEKFQSPEKIKIAFNQLRLQAIKSGMKGVSIAIALSPNKTDVALAESCGFDILTGYNYHTAGFIPDKKIIPIENMQKGEINIWNQFSNLTDLPYIPVTTLDWDPRPWANSKNNYSTAPYFNGFSPSSVYNSILACKNWIKTHSKKTVKERIGLIYAWNEYGEGAYLTPTKNGINLLEGVKKALKN